MLEGVLPPLNEAQWIESFGLYQKTPEYLQVNSHFSLGEYKKIYFWEWFHRLLARVIFLWAFLGGIFLFVKKEAPAKLAFGLPLLVATQGLIGWLMVRSGLQQDPHVSPYMLAMHFILAVGIGAYAHYYLSKLRPPLEVSFSKRDWWQWNLVGVLLLLQIFYGCLVGGLKAGFMYNTYPLMGSQFIPAGSFYMQPWIANLFENPIVTQWIHRWLGVLLAIVLVWVVPRILKRNRNSNLSLPLYHFLGIIIFQILLGIVVLLLKVQISFAALHQLCGAMIAITYLGISFRLKRGGLA